MERPVEGASRGTLTPDRWPDWVLSFRGGYFPDDDVKQSDRLTEFHQWQREKAAWFAVQGITYSWMSCHHEHRRRAKTQGSTSSIKTQPRPYERDVDV